MQTKPSSRKTGLSERGSSHQVLGIVLLVTAGVAVYANSFSAPWVFDGSHIIRENTAIRKLWPPWLPMLGTSRPVTMLSFAMNYAVGGPEVWGYHAVNLAIHLAAGLALMAVARRALESPRLPDHYRHAAPWLGMAVALLWLVHPLQTQSVTYLYQRFESLMGLFALLTFYAFLRGLDSAKPVRWYVASVACFLAGLGCKETTAVTPLVLLWYDRALGANSWRELWYRRGRLYVVFGAILGSGVLGLFVHRAWYAQGGLMAADRVTVAEYALSQPGVVAHYLRLCFWPAGQCLDYAWPIARTPAEIVPPLLFIVGLATATAWCLAHRPALGFLGGVFFLFLAPTSSFVPIVDLAFEHRMYLPLAPVAAVIVIGTYELSRRLRWPAEIAPDDRARRVAVVAAAAAVLLGLTTIARNGVYHDEQTLWADVVEKAPHNARARLYLGNAVREDRPDLALEHYHRATELQPTLGEAHNNLANLLQRSDPNQALAHYQTALELDPAHVEAHNNLANLLARRGDYHNAIGHYREAIRLQPDFEPARQNLAIVEQMVTEAHPSQIGKSGGDGH